jgi:hypothetical protein
VEAGSSQQVEGLEHKPDFAIPNEGQFVIVHRADKPPIDEILALRGVSRQPIRFINVGLSEPEGPMIARYSPFVTVKETPARAWIFSAPIS